MYSYYFILTDKRPELCHLVELLAPIRSNWGLIGRQLGVDIQVIDDVNKSNQMKLDEVIQIWIETKPTPTTWFNIITVVQKQSPDVADTIRKYLDQILSEQKRAKISSM